LPSWKRITRPEATIDREASAFKIHQDLGHVTLEFSNIISLVTVENYLKDLMAIP
jgi:hypothetical protein